MAQTEVTPADQTAAAAAPPAVPAGDPAIIGLPSFIAGAVGLGLTLVDYVSPASQAAALPLIMAATGLGLVIATIWAMQLAQNAVAGIFGVFAGFWISYSLLLLGLGHGWYGVVAADVAHTVALFAIAWLVVIVALTLATLALPSAFTLLFVLVDLAVALVLAATLQDSATLRHLAGWAVFAFTAVGIYLYIGSCLQATGKRGLPLGPAVLK
jgi:hypothetical protein